MATPLNLQQKLVVAIAGSLLALLAWQLIAGVVLLQFMHRPLSEAGPLTFVQYWHYYGDWPGLHRLLGQSAGLAAVGILIPAVMLLLPRRNKLHGDARFARRSEIRRALNAERGVIVGQAHGRVLVYGGSQHVLMCAPTRSGKGVSIVVPNLLSWHDSVVVLDIKQENYDLTSGYRAKYGQEVHLLNFSARDYRTSRWNPLSYISDDPNHRIDDIQKIAGFLFPNVDGEDPIWSASSRSLFLGVVLFLIETGRPVTMGETLRQVCQGEEAGKYFAQQIAERADKNQPLSGECVSALNDFINTSTNTRTSIRKTFSSRLELWFNPVIDAATAGNDFDLRELRRRRLSIYVGIPPNNLERLTPVLNLFFQQLIDLNTDELPMQNPALQYQCLLLMDEFTAIGKIKILSKGISYIAGYGLRMLPIIQNPAQVKEVYGHEAAATFDGNHALHIVFAPAQHDQDVAERLSKSLGDQTWRVKSTGRSSGKSGSSSSQNQSDQRRPLMLPQEVKDIGPRRQFVFAANCPPIFCDKLHYYESPLFIDRLKEVSPSLAALGKALPTHAQLQQVVAAGELAAPSRILTVTRLATVAGAAVPSETDEAEAGGEAIDSSRPVTLDDIEALTLDDLSCDFTDIVIEGDPPTDAEMQRAANALLLRLVQQPTLTEA